MAEEIKVLQIDDDEIDVRLAKRALTKSTQQATFSIESAGTLAEGIENLKKVEYDIVLLDLGLPDSAGIEGVQKVSQVNPNIPIVVLTGLEDEQTGLAAIKSGAADYLVKGPSMENFLARTVLYAIERRKVGEKLRESQQMLQLVMNSIPQAVFWKDRNSAYLGCNPNFARDAGLSSPEEVAGKTDYDFSWRKEEADFFREVDQRVMKNDAPEYHIIEPQLQADGKQAWVETNKVPLHDSKGNVVGILGSYEDITQRRQAERELQLAEERYRTIFENSAVAITMADDQERLVSWNRFTEDLLAMKKEDLYLRPVKSLYPGGEWQRIRTHDVRQKGMQHHLETKMTKKNGQVIDVDVSLSVLKDPDGRITGSIGVIRDITERKKSEDQIRKLSRAVEQSPASVIITDLNGNIEYVNPRFTQITGYAPEEVRGKTPRISKSGEHPSQFYKDLWDTITSGKEWRGEFHNKKKNGDLYWEFAYISPIRNAEGGVTHFVAVKEDITQRKEAEEKLKEAMEIKSRFISTVSHELRTPMTIIKEDIAIVLDGAAGKIYPKQREMLEMAQRNIDRLARLINDVLDFQKLNSGKATFRMQKNNINEIIEGIYKTMAATVQKKGVELNLALDDGVPRIDCDNDKIVQVLTNLVSNSMKFTEKGEITISTRKIENAVKVSVADTGPGIKQEDMSRLFRQFEQLATAGGRKTGGTGLGLAISKEIVEKHGGRIWAESELGKGTTFHFLLPLTLSTSSVKQSESVPAAAGSQTG